ncbi:unnamed protein product, partial [Polarella glacialis]
DVFREAGLDPSSVPMDAKHRAARAAAKTDKAGDAPFIPLDTATTNLVSEVARSAVNDDGSLQFEYWPDEGSGSWIRLTGQKWPRKRSAFPASQLPVSILPPPSRPPPPADSAAKHVSSLPGWVRKISSSSAKDEQPSELKEVQASTAATPLSPSPSPAAPTAAASSRQEGLEPEDEPQGHVPAAEVSRASPTAWGGCASWGSPQAAKGGPQLRELPPGAGSAKRNKAANKMPPTESEQPTTAAAAAAAEVGSDAAAAAAVGGGSDAGGGVGVVQTRPAMDRGESALPATGPAQRGTFTGELKRFFEEKGCGFIRCSEFSGDIYVPVSSFTHNTPSNGIISVLPDRSSVGCTVQFELDSRSEHPRAVRARILEQREVQAPRNGQVHRGRIKTFLKEKGYGFVACNVEGEEVTVFCHSTIIAGPKPEQLSGQSGHPAVGEEVDFCVDGPLVEGARIKSTWCRVVGPALVMDPLKHLKVLLRWALRGSVERNVPPVAGKVGIDGFVTMQAALTCERVLPATEALGPPGSVEAMLAGKTPPAIFLEALQDVSSVVTAPNSTAAMAQLPTAPVAAGQPEFHIWTQVRDGEITGHWIRFAGQQQCYRPSDRRDYDQDDRYSRPAQPPPASIFGGDSQALWRTAKKE